MDFYFKGIWRMDWGLGNPNKTAALIAVLMITIWVLPMIRRWFFWVALPVFTGLGICLMHTMSRGGVVAVFAGFAVILWKLPRPWPKGHVIATTTAITIMLLGAVALQATNRFAQDWHDRSITNRLDIWKYTPRMMVDAPAGWGRGNAATAFSSWYQPLDRGERYVNLVSGHLTWLVELGWPMRLLYALGWSTVFVLCYSPQRKPGFAIALGAWLSFFIANVFSMVMDIFWIWLVLAVSFAGVLIARFRSRNWPVMRTWNLGLGAGMLTLAMLYAIGRMCPSGNFTVGNNGPIYVGGKEPKIWVLVCPIASPATISNTYPRNLREHLEKEKGLPAIGVASSLSDLPNLTGCRLAVIGSIPKKQWRDLNARIQTCNKLLLLSPDVSPDELKFPPKILAKTTVAFGEFSGKATISSWKNAANFQQIEGVGDFFQYWPELVFSTLK